MSATYKGYPKGAVETIFDFERGLAEGGIPLRVYGLGARSFAYRCLDEDVVVPVRSSIAHDFSLDERNSYNDNFLFFDEDAAKAYLAHCLMSGEQSVENQRAHRLIGEHIFRSSGDS